MPSYGLVTPNPRVCRKLFADDGNTDAIKDAKVAFKDTFNKILEEERSRAKQLYNFDTDKNGPMETTTGSGRYNWVAMRGANVPSCYIYKPRDLYPKCSNQDIVSFPQTMQKACDSQLTSSQDASTFIRSQSQIAAEQTPRRIRLRQSKVTELMKISKSKRSLETTKRKRPDQTSQQTIKQTRIGLS